MKIAAAKYEKPATTEKPNPYIDLVREFTDKGIDTPFEITTTAGEYKADKLLIQKAVNVHGFSAREVVAPELEGVDESADVTGTFLVRPKRKAKGEGSEDAAAE